MLADNELLRRYFAEHSESAFAELVERHASLVYGAALSQVHGDAGLARDATQIVFMDLARKSGVLLKHRSIAGWLYTSAKFVAAKLTRTEERRQSREQRASNMSTPDLSPDLSPEPARLRPLIEEAMQQLPEVDREAVLLRFFEKQDFKTVGHLLGLSDEAARKRVTRAVERLRAALHARGISSSESAMTSALSGAAAVALPAELQARIVAGALATSIPTPAAPLLQLLHGKTLLAFTAIATTLVTVWILPAVALSRSRAKSNALSAQLAAYRAGDRNPASASNSPVSQEELAGLRREHSELLRLRDEITRLHAGQRQLPTPVAAQVSEEPPALPQVTIETKFLKQPSSALKRLGMDAIGLDITGVGVTAILTDSQLSALLGALQSKSGEILAAPRVTTLSSRQASVSLMASADVPAGGTILGPTADLLASVYPDRTTVSLQAAASLAEKVPASDALDAGQEVVQQTSVSGEGVLKDGQTLVLCQRVGRTAGGVNSQEEENQLLLVLITPTLIDPAGNRIHPTDTRAGERSE